MSGDLWPAKLRLCGCHTMTRASLPAPHSIDDAADVVA
ncbi:hypothetical protein MicloDRAFT_00069790, partial [Microvirga lotononidis]